MPESQMLLQEMGNHFSQTLHERPNMSSSIWLLDQISDLPPTTRLDGFDISLDQCPPSPWLPANVKFHTWNVFDDPAPEFVGVFDIVHVRLVTVVIKNNDPRAMLSNLHKLLSEVLGVLLRFPLDKPAE